ncbi:MAG: hypothetical protein C4532_02400 [Candidatus Abyssobacteria bacterium SURF_17]|uniref:Uncharacterized protein n=1 Tax=Candidatus Abyssobacteria bacterium SURF_17 TaxID=2093361 RepID=A0A419F7M4_9BACT|nr:MAG: hypothetical protein C4532_02400 [Candidatus Abyssubacteria bacterium SURF_17]
MPELIIKTDDPDFFRDLKEAHIPDLSIDQRIRAFASVELPPVLELLSNLIVVVTGGVSAIQLFRNWLHNRIKQGNPHKIAIEDQEVTQDPKQVFIVIDKYIQQTQINIDNKPTEQKQP